MPKVAHGLFKQVDLINSPLVAYSYPPQIVEQSLYVSRVREEKKRKRDAFCERSPCDCWARIFCCLLRSTTARPERGRRDAPADWDYRSRCYLHGGSRFLVYAGYGERLALHLKALEEGATGARMHYQRLVTDQPLDAGLSGYLRVRAGRA